MSQDTAVFSKILSYLPNIQVYIVWILICAPNVKETASGVQQLQNKTQKTAPLVEQCE